MAASWRWAGGVLDLGRGRRLWSARVDDWRWRSPDSRWSLVGQRVRALGTPVRRRLLLLLLHDLERQLVARVSVLGRGQKGEVVSRAGSHGDVHVPCVCAVWAVCRVTM